MEVLADMARIACVQLLAVGGYALGRVLMALCR